MRATVCSTEKEETSTGATTGADDRALLKRSRSCSGERRHFTTSSTRGLTILKSWLCIAWRIMRPTSCLRRAPMASSFRTTSSVRSFLGLRVQAVLSISRLPLSPSHHRVTAQSGRDRRFLVILSLRSVLHTRTCADHESSRAFCVCACAPCALTPTLSLSSPDWQSRNCLTLPGSRMDEQRSRSDAQF